MHGLLAVSYCSSDFESSIRWVNSEVNPSYCPWGHARLGGHAKTRANITLFGPGDPLKLRFITCRVDSSSASFATSTIGWTDINTYRQLTNGKSSRKSQVFWPKNLLRRQLWRLQDLRDAVVDLASPSNSSSFPSSNYYLHLRHRSPTPSYTPPL